MGPWHRLLPETRLEIFSFMLGLIGMLVELYPAPNTAVGIAYLSVAFLKSLVAFIAISWVLLGYRRMAESPEFAAISKRHYRFIVAGTLIAVVVRSGWVALASS